MLYLKWNMNLSYEYKNNLFFMEQFVIKIKLIHEKFVSFDSKSRIVFVYVYVQMMFRSIKWLQFSIQKRNKEMIKWNNELKRAHFWLKWKTLLRFFFKWMKSFSIFLKFHSKLLSLLKTFYSFLFVMNICCLCFTIILYFFYWSYYSNLFRFKQPG